MIWRNRLKRKRLVQKLVINASKKLSKKQRNMFSLLGGTKKNFEGSFGTTGSLGGKRKITLKENVDYTLETLTEEILKQYVDKDNKHLFETSFVYLATNQEQFISKFVNKEGHECKFWEYYYDTLKKPSNEYNYLILKFMNLSAFQIRK
ncbi:uncharacterized protein LOC127290370 [Leptopilina boulardi]|uniref:uncharacterized protein LOC127290370 n=1 Tax=Leptopilina boulardi TaxID=63433 RepID=UPI0021F5B6D4|nr:uncharacterized protein LOC127290370 [Leptopilina boulardi]